MPKTILNYTVMILVSLGAFIAIISTEAPKEIKLGCYSSYLMETEAIDVFCLLPDGRYEQYSDKQGVLEKYNENTWNIRSVVNAREPYRTTLYDFIYPEVKYSDLDIKNNPEKFSGELNRYKKDFDAFAEPALFGELYIYIYKEGRGYVYDPYLHGTEYDYLQPQLSTQR